MQYFRTLLLFALLANSNPTIACSMYKITVDGKTMVGCNEDAWRTTSSIWFENAKNDHENGAAFTGSRRVGQSRIAPQSGMNEAGLVFSRLASYYPRQEEQIIAKKAITNEVEYLSGILHQCRSVDEVKRYIEQYDHSFFIEDVFIYVDQSGKYLVVEPYNLIEGNKSSYVLSNFCPSITDPASARNLDRYRNGDDFLKAHPLEASIAYCTALSDTMHVCRNRNGDGTLLTSIWDGKNGLVNLYFYHNFDGTVQFNLSQELAKGDHMLQVADLFPVNAEFERLKTYKTPFNTPALRVLLVLLAGVLFTFALLLLVHYFFKSESNRFDRIYLFSAMINVILIGYLFVLATNVNVYYFDAPYKHYSSFLISLSSYIPYFLLIALIPLLFYSARMIKSKENKRWIKGALVLNSLIYLALIAGFNYWGLTSLS